MSFETYRKLFPVTLQQVYLNHAAISPFSNKLSDALEEHIDERSFGIIDTDIMGMELREKTRRQVGGLINADPEQIAFIGNTTEGFNHLVNGLAWQKGDQVILADCEFPANIYPFLNLERQGVEIVFVKERGGKIQVRDIERLLTKKSKLLSLSFVEFSNGFKNDLQTIGALCNSHDIIFSVDGIQGIGAIPFDAQQYQVDFLANGGHKWLMGPMGCGFMYMHPNLFEKLIPRYVGWLGVENADDYLDYQLDILPNARRYEYATSNFMGLAGLHASINLLREVGPENIAPYLFKLGRKMIDSFNTFGLKFMGSEDEDQWSGIFSFSGPRMEELFHALQEEQIICSLRSGMLRVSPHFYNSLQEIEKLIEHVGKFYR